MSNLDDDKQMMIVEAACYAIVINQQAERTVIEERERPSYPSPRSVIPDGPFPGDSAERKKYPVFSGVLMYFPEAMAALALRSFESQAEHNPTGRIEWIKEKSIGDGNEIVRHLMESEIAYLNGDYVTAAEEAAAVHWRGAEFHQRMLTGIEPFERK